MTLHLSSIALFLVTEIFGVYCSHFRGGLITWKPVGTNQIEIFYRIAFRRSYGNNHMCTENIISNGTLLQGEGTLYCLSGCNDAVASITAMPYYCTDFSITEDWTTGVRTFTYTLPASSTSIYHFGYSSCCWISLASGGNGDWIVRTVADFNIRNDTGKINSSPTTGIQPIIRLNFGCYYQIKIPVADEDGDVVRCRWATQTPDDECGGICQTFNDSVLDEDTCTLSYNATVQTGWYAVAIQIEDFPSTSSNNSLSSVPLQFLVLVANTNENCTSKPLFLSNIITDGSFHYLLANEFFNVTIIARSGDETVSIIEITTLSPRGMIKSELHPHGSSGREWSVHIMWTPTLAATGNNIFCFSATDDVGQTSDQVCATLVVRGEELTSSVETRTDSYESPLVTVETTSQNFRGSSASTATDSYKSSVYSVETTSQNFHGSSASTVTESYNSSVDTGETTTQSYQSSSGTVIPETKRSTLEKSIQISKDSFGTASTAIESNQNSTVTIEKTTQIFRSSPETFQSITRSSKNSPGAMDTTNKHSLSSHIIMNTVTESHNSSPGTVDRTTTSSGSSSRTIYSATESSSTLPGTVYTTANGYRGLSGTVNTGIERFYSSPEATENSSRSPATVDMIKKSSRGSLDNTTITPEIEINKKDSPELSNTDNYFTVVGATSGCVLGVVTITLALAYLMNYIQSIKKSNRMTLHNSKTNTSEPADFFSVYISIQRPMNHYKSLQ